MIGCTGNNKFEIREINLSCSSIHNPATHLEGLSMATQKLQLGWSTSWLRFELCVSWTEARNVIAFAIFPSHYDLQHTLPLICSEGDVYTDTTLRSIFGWRLDSALCTWNSLMPLARSCDSRLVIRARCWIAWVFKKMCISREIINVITHIYVRGYYIRIFDGTQAILTEVSRVFLSPFQANAVTVFRSGRDSFLSRASHFMIY